MECRDGRVDAGASAGAVEDEVKAEAEVDRGNARPVEATPRRRRRRRRAQRLAAGSMPRAPQQARASRARRSTQWQTPAVARRRAHSTALVAPPSWRPRRDAPRLRGGGGGVEVERALPSAHHQAGEAAAAAAGAAAASSRVLSSSGAKARPTAWCVACSHVCRRL
eukprot:scaffold23767_cov62-Phaeocystis_antarctica.AAC.2